MGGAVDDLEVPCGEFLERDPPFARFQKVNASVELLPVMNQDDLRAGMAKLG